MPVPSSSALHALTWLVWAAAAAVTVQLAPSPVYVALVVAVAVLVVDSAGTETPLAAAFPALLALGALFALVRVVLTAATTHAGGDALLVLPDATLPRLLGGFDVGGPVETAVLLQATAEGFAVVGIIAAFAAFNAVASHAELVRAAPRAYHEPGLVVTVALAFVPATLSAVVAVREADLARTGGRIVRRGRLVRSLVPLLESGMERAVGLAESMDARGFGRATEASAGGWWAAAALVALGGAFVALVGRSAAVALVLGLIGVLALVVAVRRSSAGAGVTRHRPRHLNATDRGVMVAVLLAPAGVALLGALGDSSLTWTAVEPLRLPAFNPLVALAMAPLALPALLHP